MNLGLAYNNINKNNTTQTTVGAQLIKAELDVIFNTPKYSMFFGNNFGVDLEKYLFMRNREATFHLVRDDINNALNKYGKVILQKMIMTFKSDSKLVIDIEVTVRQTRETIQHRITVI